MATKPELQATLKEAGIEFGAKDSKDELQSLVASHKEAEAIRIASIKSFEGNVDLKLKTRMPDGSEHECVFTIVNPAGCMLKTQVNNPNVIFDGLRAGLIREYGANHIKG